MPNNINLDMNLSKLGKTSIKKVEVKRPSNSEESAKQARSFVNNSMKDKQVRRAVEMLAAE